MKILITLFLGRRKEKPEGENAGHARYCFIDPGSVTNVNITAFIDIVSGSPWILGSCPGECTECL